MKTAIKILKIAGFVCLLILAAFGAALGALPLQLRRREDPARDKTELVETKKEKDSAYKFFE